MSSVSISDIESTGTSIDPNDLFLMSKFNQNSGTYSSVKVFGSTLQKSFGANFLDFNNVFDSGRIRPGDTTYWGENPPSSDNGSKWVTVTTQASGLKKYTGNIVVTAPYDCLFTIYRNVRVNPINTSVREFYSLSTYGVEVPVTLNLINRSISRYTVYSNLEPETIQAFHDTVANNVFLKSGQKVLIQIQWGISNGLGVIDGYYGVQPTSNTGSYWIDESGDTVYLMNNTENVGSYGPKSSIYTQNNYLQYQIFGL